MPSINLRKFIRFSLVVFIQTILANLHVFAQDNQDVTYLGIEKGLSNNSVNTIYKDKFGYMWFGTDDGLDRYDGYDFKIFRHNNEDSSSLIHNRVFKLAEDGTGNLWVGTISGLSIYDNYSSKFYCPKFQSKSSNELKPLTDRIFDILKGKNGDMYVATYQCGLLIKHGDEPLKEVNINSKIFPKNYSIAAFAQDKMGIWMVVTDYGLCLFHPKDNSIILVNDKIKSANTILIDKKDVLWIGGSQGFCAFYPKSGKVNWFMNLKSQLLSDRVLRIMDIKEDKTGKMWIGTDGGGVNVFNPKTNKVESIVSRPERNSLKSDAVMTVYCDDEDRVWIGTLNGGVNLIDNRKNKFKTISHDSYNKNSLISDFVHSFCEDSNHQIWIGTYSGGVSVWNRKSNHFQNYTNEKSNPGSINNHNITSIIEDHKGRVWLATFGGGINRFDPKTKNFSHFVCQSKNGVDKNVWKLYEDSRQQIWAGTAFGSAVTYKWSESKKKFLPIDSRISSVTTISEDHDRNIWFGTEYGYLIKVDSATKNLIKYNFKHPIRAFYEDKSGIIWLGVQYTGLIKLNPKTGRIKVYSETAGLCNNSLLSILSDESGNLWISTFNGLSRFNSETEKFRNFYESDGLQSNQFNYNAALKLKNGELLFGGIKGFNIVDPNHTKDDNSFPKLLITGVKVMDKPIAQSDEFSKETSSLPDIKELILPYSKAVLSIDFAALDYSAPDKISYAYYLDGWDKSWTYSNNFRTAYYSKLDAGTYTLRIKSTNANGLWNPKELSIIIEVLPPWYRTFWAYLFYFSCLVGMVIIYNRYRVNQAMLKHELEIGKIKAEKDKEINENKLAFFTNISHEFRTPLTLIINPVKELMEKTDTDEQNQSLKVIYRNAKRLLSLIDQLLIFRKAENDVEDLHVQELNISDVAYEAFACFINEAKKHQINYVFETKVEEAKIYGDKEKLEIAIFNLLANALKFTPDKGGISLRIFEDQQRIYLEVKDSGEGIDINLHDEIFQKFYQTNKKGKQSKIGFGIGLYLVKKLLDQHKGEVSYKNNEPHGAVFTIGLIKGFHHFEATQLLNTTTDFRAKSNLIEELAPSETAEDNTEVSFNNSEFLSDQKTILIVDDNDEIRTYIKGIFKSTYCVIEADNGYDALVLTKSEYPDLIISDILMEGLDGIELCKEIKEDPAISYIPVILLTASASSENKLKGIEGGAEDYISKPFDKDLLIAKVQAILKSRNNLQKYFLNEVTLKPDNFNVSQEHKDFIDNCMKIVVEHLKDNDFTIEILAKEIGMSHSSLYKKVKSISGQSVNEFIRFIRLRKAAEMLLGTDYNINEAAYNCGFNDIKYFREQFFKLYGLNPSEFVKKNKPIFEKKFKKNKHLK